MIGLTPEVIGVLPVDIDTFEAIRIYERLDLLNERVPRSLSCDERGEVFSSCPSSERNDSFNVVGFSLLDESVNIRSGLRERNL